MIRKAFYMELKPGRLEAYVKAHNPIPRELAAALKRCGVSNYSIFCHADRNVLICVFEADDEEKLAGLADCECCRVWWKEMTENLVVAVRGDEKAREEPMTEVFYLQ